MDTVKEIGGYIGVGAALVATAFLDKLIFISFMYITKPIATGISNIVSWF